MIKRSRAVSEVIASLIMLLIVSVLGTYLYSYSLTETGVQQNNLEGDIQTEAGRAQERFKVIACIYEGNLLNLTVLNYGRLDIKIVDVYLDSNRVALSPGEEIYTSDLGLISFTYPGLVPDVLYEIVIVSERGVSHVYSWKC